jgi:hypothetical protein
MAAISRMAAWPRPGRCPANIRRPWPGAAPPPVQAPHTRRAPAARKPGSREAGKPGAFRQRGSSRTTASGAGSWPQSLSLNADERPSRISQPASRTNIRWSRRNDTAGHYAQQPRRTYRARSQPWADLWHPTGASLQLSGRAGFWHPQEDRAGEGVRALASHEVTGYAGELLAPCPAAALRPGRARWVRRRTALGVSCPQVGGHLRQLPGGPAHAASRTRRTGPW